MTSLAIDPGTDRDVAFTYLQSKTGPPVNITGYHARFSIIDAEGVRIATWLDTDTDPLVVIDGVNGKVSVTIDGNALDAYPNTTLRWECVITSPAGKRTRLDRGRLNVTPALVGT